MNLYRIEFAGLPCCYVVAPDPTEAYRKVRAVLDEENYGYRYARALKSIHLVAIQGHLGDNGTGLWL